MSTRRIQVEQAELHLVQGDIVTQEVDVIVNAANSGLCGGGGVDGAIHRAGGPTILAECRRIGHCPTGEAVLTTAGNLLAQRIIHTVGPIWQGGTAGEARMLASSYRKSLQIADREGFASIAFPSLSTGAYGYPIELAAPVALQAVMDALKEARSITSVRFVLYNNSCLEAYTNALGALL